MVLGLKIILKKGDIEGFYRFNDVFLVEFYNIGVKVFGCGSIVIRIK